MVVKTDDEAKVLKSITFITERMKELKNNEALNVKERAQLAKSYVDQFQQQTARLVNLINERVAAEKEAAKKQAETDASNIKKQQEKQQFEADQLKNLNRALQLNQREVEKAESDKLKTRQEFSAYHIKAERELQEELRRLTGRFTEKEKYTKSKKYLELSMNDQVKAEVEQAKKIETIMKAYERARSRSTRGNDMDSYYQKSADALLAYAQKEKTALQEMIYGRLNATKKLMEEERKAAKSKEQDSIRRTADEKKRLKELSEADSKKIKDQQMAEKSASDMAKRVQKEQVAAAKRSQKAWSEMFEAMGLGWRNRNMMESFQQFSHSIRRFGHDIGVMAQTVARHLVYITGSLAAFGAGVAAALAVASKKMYDFGAEIIKTTEEVRSYNIALYGMMNTQSGVNDMMRVAEKVTKEMPIGFKTIQESVKGLVLIGPVRDMLRNTEDIEKVMGSLFKIVVGLSQIQPMWGAKGAIFSLRNALTGDLRSLQRRFELPVRAIYSAEGVPLQNLQYQPEKMVETLDTYISSFYSSETLKMSSDQFGAIMEKMTGNWIKFVSSIGESGFYDTVMKDFKAVRDLIEDFVSGPNFGSVTKSISDAMTNMYVSISRVGKYIGGYVGKIFGINDIGDVNVITAAFEMLAKTIKYLEQIITSGKLGEFLKSGGEQIYNTLIAPISEFKNLVVEMASDAISMFSKMSKVIGGAFSDNIGGIADNKMLKKGVLWTLFFGPSNVAMLMGSISLLVNSAMGLLANSINVAVKGFNILRASHVAVFAGDVVRAAAGRAILMYENFSGLATGTFATLKAAHLAVWMTPLTVAGAMITKIGLVVGGLFATIAYKDEIKSALDEVAKWSEKFLENLVKGIGWFIEIAINQVIDTLSQRSSTFASWFSTKNTNSKEQLRYQIEGQKDIIYRNSPDKVKSDLKLVSDKIQKQELKMSTIGGASDSAIEQAALAGLIQEQRKIYEGYSRYETAQKELARLLAIDASTLPETNNLFAPLTDKIRSFADGGVKFFKVIVGLGKAVSAAATDGYDDIETLRNSLEKYKAKMKKPVDLGEDFGAVRETTVLIKQLEEMGLKPMITSGFRDDTTDHGTGRTIDLQFYNKKTGAVLTKDETNTPAFMSKLQAIKDNPLVERLLVEQDRRGLGFDLQKMKESGFETVVADESAGHIHVKLRKLNDVVDAGGQFVTQLQDTFSNIGDVNLDSFEGLKSTFNFERGGEFMRSLDNLEIGMKFVTKALEMRYKKMTDLVQSTFEELKDEDGHLFGPEAIEKLEASYKAEATNRKKTFDKIRGEAANDIRLGRVSDPSATVESVTRSRAYDEIRLRKAGSGLDTAAPAFMKDAYPKMVEQMIIGMAGGRGISPASMAIGIAIGAQSASGGFADNLRKQGKQANKEASEVVYKYEEFQKRFRQTIDMSKKYSGEFLQDKLVERTYDLIQIPFDLAQETFSRSFDTKALEEAFALTNAIFANFAATDKIISQASNKYINMIANGATEAEALEGALKAYLSSGGKDVSSAIAFLDTLRKQRDVIIETMKPLEQQRKTYADMTANLKKMTMEELKRHKAAYLNSPNANVRKSWGADYESRIAEGIESDSLGNMFTTGIDIAMAEWDNFGTIVVNSGKTIANDLRQSFEDGFFDVMTGKLQGFREMFKNIGNTILQTIYKIIAQMAAISTTEIILGVNLQGALGGGKSSGGVGGVLSSVLGGGGSSSGGLVGGLVSGLLGNFGFSGIAGSANKDVVSKAMNVGTGIMGAAGGIDLTSLTSAGIAGAVAGSKGSGLLGKLTPVKEWISANALPILGVAAVGSFLSQPGRVFGGKKDKTGNAYAQYTDANQQRTAMVGRRGTDAINYYMGMPSAIQNAQFAGIGYNTWTSGDGWARGPKEKHAATDTSAYIKSLYGYYELLMSAGKAHYQKMNQINKLAETNSLESLKQQQVFDEQKLTLIKTEYERYASTSYTAADKWDKMDEYRNQQLDQEYANLQLQNEVAKVTKETKYAEMQYLTFVKSNGEDVIAMERTNIEIQKLKIAELTENTLEWYNAKMELMTSEKDLANSLKEQAKTTQSIIDSGVKEIYKLGRNGYRSGFVPTGMWHLIGTPTADPKAAEYAVMVQTRDRLKNGNYTAVDFAKLSKTGSRPTEQFKWKEIGKYQYQDFGFWSTFPTLPSEYFDNPDYRRTEERVTSATPTSKKITHPGTTFTIDGKTYKQGDTIQFDKDIIETWYKKEYESEALYSVGDLVNVSLKEAMDYVKEQLEKDAENFIKKYSLQVETQNLYKNIGDALKNIDNSVKDRFNYLNAVQTNYNLDTLMSSDEKEIAQAELGVDIANFYLDLSNNINQWLKQGYINVGDSAVNSFSSAISGGLNEGALAFYEQLRQTTQKMGVKGNVFSSIKDMEDFSLFNQVMNMSEMKDMRNILGMQGVGTGQMQITGAGEIAGYQYYSDGTKKPLYSAGKISEIMDYGAGYDDPYQAWFEFTKQTIMSRIANTQSGSDEWYVAQNDLFNLMIENAERLKQKAEEVNRSIEDMLGKIEETMRMRIAEERETSKGDVYFIDVGATRNSQKMLDDMLAKVQTNDPQARLLIEEFRKKMMGIGR